MAWPHPLVIDLTIDDDEEVSERKPIPSLPDATRRAPRPTQSPLRAPKAQRVPQLSSIRQQPANSRTPSTTSLYNAQERQLTISSNGLPEPQAKRQRTSVEQLEPEWEDLLAYINTRILPVLDEAVRQLPFEDEELRRELHFKVFESISNSLEVEWRNNDGQIQKEIEDVVQDRVRQQVLELKDRPERLQFAPAARRPTIEPSTVLPSVEIEADRPIPETIAKKESEPLLHFGLDEDTSAGQARSAPVYADGIPEVPPPLPRSRRPKKVSPVTPQRLRARVKAKQWQSGRTVEEKGQNDEGLANTSFGLSARPYLRFYERAVVFGRNHTLQLDDFELHHPLVIHVDFSDSEVRYLQYVARNYYDTSKAHTKRSSLDDLRHLLKKAKKMNRREEILALHRSGYEGFAQPPAALCSRSAGDLENFVVDLHVRRLRTGPPQTFTITRDELNVESHVARANRVPSLLFAREAMGNRAFGSTRRYEDFNTAFKTSHEDALEPQIEWTNCAGDIMTLNWVSDSQFLCGTTTHSDSHNQQYNKPGNLLLGSTQGMLRAFPDHRILRPVVAEGDNALDSMVESQDPWLFTSVVDSDYDAKRNLAFTASFDKTVKIWRIKDNGMEAIGTWEHQGRVNFVLCSKHPSGMTATAADVCSGAVRVYHTGGDSSIHTFDSYSCTKIHEEDDEPSEKWAYCPAAIRWGLAQNIQHLLLIGYSPRSLTGDDRDIPEDKLTTGELCIWDTIRKSQIKVNSLATQNVFEVAWHPSRDSFAVATSKAQTLEKIEHNVKTQIRIFELNSDGQYGAVKTLDCPGVDINELVLRPNSLAYSYVAAGCTDGKIYVWDTAGDDLPMCVLQHGEPVEEFIGEKELEDVGVKFITWGTTADRLYTGSSDGVVKVWNIRHGKSVHLRDLIEVSGPITAGAFSPDYTKLVIGDGSGRVYLLTLENETVEQKPSGNGTGLLKMQVGGRQKAIRRPRPFIPHPEVPSPDSNSSRLDLNLGQERAKGYLQRGEIALHPHPCIGAIQGPGYGDTMLFRAEAHLDENVTLPLLAHFERHQQENVVFPSAHRIPRLREVQERRSQNTVMADVQNRWWQYHRGKHIDEDTQAELEAERAEIDSDYDFEYESCYDEDEDEDGSNEDD